MFTRKLRALGFFFSVDRSQMGQQKCSLLRRLNDHIKKCQTVFLYYCMQYPENTIFLEIL